MKLASIVLPIAHNAITFLRRIQFNALHALLISKWIIKTHRTYASKSVGIHSQQTILVTCLWETNMTDARTSAKCRAISPAGI